MAWCLSGAKKSATIMMTMTKAVHCIKSVETLWTPYLFSWTRDNMEMFFHKKTGALKGEPTIIQRASDKELW